MSRSRMHDQRVNNVLKKQFVWRDKEGLIIPDNSKALTAFRGNLYGYEIGAGEKIACIFHMPHEWIDGTDLYIHPHWGHNGTIVGPDDYEWTIYASYAHRKADLATVCPVFPAEVSTDIVVSGVTSTSHPQYCHSVDEILFATKGGAGAMFDSDDIATDGIILATVELKYEPGLGVGGKTFLFTADLHYQGRPYGTTNKDPDENYNYNHD